MDDPDLIRQRVLRGIVLNRVPGYHFAGNFLDVSFDRVTTQDVSLTLDPGPHCVDREGQASHGAIALFADLALAATVRAQLDRAARLATVSMTLQFTGAPRIGRLTATSSFEGFFADGAERLGTGRVMIAARSDAGATPVCFGTGAFMAIAPPKNMVLQPIPHRRRDDPDVPLPGEDELAAAERLILRHADTTLARINGSGASFIDTFWGYRPRKLKEGAGCTLATGAHITNRVGHVQGGVLFGLAAATAQAALAPSWALSGMTASFVSPGEGKGLRARAKIVHQGRLTAVVRTQVVRSDRRVVLDVVSNHVHRSGGAAK